jgi:multiple sugar transport system ATP-binding protein
MASVKLEHVTKKYDDVTAVEDMNLKINDGEFVTFVGPSGCGKSTTMETIAGLTIPTSGSIYIGDREVTNLPPKDRGISMVFQNIALFPHMDVYDNISFGLRLRKYEQDEIDHRVEEAAEVVQLEGMMDRMPEEMSGGQRQRVAIARALVREPDVFLMDEPLANLDAKLRVHMRTQLQRIHRDLETTIIYVTHDQAEAMTMSDRIAVIDAGELQQIDPPLVCYNEPDNLFVAGFIGSPAMNFVRGEITPDGFTSDVGEIDVEFDPAAVGTTVGQQVTLGIRPEDIYRSRKPTGSPTRRDSSTPTPT